MKTEELLALGVFGRGSRLGERVAMLLEHGREFSPRASRTRVAVSGIALAVCMIAGAFAPRVVAFAQQPKFDVTSVRPNKSGDRRRLMPPPTDGRFSATNVTVQGLLANAYKVFGFQIAGAPAWFSSDYFDVEGKTQGNPPPEQMNLMLQSLLADRFKLTLHRKNRTMAAYELVIARGGIKFKEGKCMGEPGPTNPCGGFFGGPSGNFIAKEAGVDELVNLLSGVLTKVVLDKTGLRGHYDMEMHWTPDESTIRGPGGPDDPPPDGSRPSIFTALEEQLGLELRSVKAPVEMLVIDHAEKPGEN